MSLGSLFFLLFLIPIVVNYFVGSIPFGLILSRMAGYGDIRKIGSNNIGATNVLRTGNKLLALATLLADMGKGGILILIIYKGFPSEIVINNNFQPNYVPKFPPDASYAFALTVGFGAILGHCFPIWLKFKGGKGVATALGVLLAAVPYSGLIAIATWLVVAFTTRYSSLSALTACAVAPIATFFVYGTMPAAICLLITIFVFVRHKENIQRLLAGTESKIGNKN